MTKGHQAAVQCLQDEIQRHRELVKELEAAIEELVGGNSGGPRVRRLKRSAMDLAIEAMQEAGGEMTSADIHEKIKKRAKVKLRSFKTMLSKEANDGDQIEKVKGRPGVYRLTQAG